MVDRLLWGDYGCDASFTKGISDGESYEWEGVLCERTWVLGRCGGRGQSCLYDETILHIGPSIADITT